MEPEQITIGPFKFIFWPEAQDPGVGMLVISSNTFSVETNHGRVTRDEWNQFLGEVDR